MPKVILALDLSSYCGWAVGAIGERPICGTWILPNIGGEGAKFASFENELADAMALHAPDHLCLEAPLSPQAVSSALVIRQQLGLRAIAYSEGYRAAAAVHERDAYTVRKEVLGTGRFQKGQVKLAVLKWAKAQGFEAPDHNACDALLLHQFYARKLVA